VTKTEDIAPEQLNSAEVEITLAEFLESHPPGSEALIVQLAGPKQMERGQEYYNLLASDIELHCSSPKCGGTRSFRLDANYSYTVTNEWNNKFLTYVCRNCESTRRTFAIRVCVTDVGRGRASKLGEYPAFGPPVPARVVSLVGPERELFLKGRRSENQGLGIGAFTYYRRVVESQWKRLVGEIIRVAEKVNASEAMIANLKRAASESQFRKAVDMIKEGVPESLKIQGQNPLTLLYGPLSEGIHDEPDEHCLGLASSIRVVLTELAERIGLALKDEAELNEAVTRLLTRKNPKSGEGAA